MAFLLIHRSNSGKPVQVEHILTIVGAIAGYGAGLLHFRSKSKWAKEFLVKLLEGKEAQ
jgi:hypothetical protein